MDPLDIAKVVIMSVVCFVSGFLIGRETVIQKWQNWRDEMHKWRRVE